MAYKIKQKLFFLSNFAFQKDIQEVGIEIQGTRGPSKISAVTKSTASVALCTSWE